MPDYAGALQRLVPSGTLWLVIAWPFVGLLWQVLVVRRRAQHARSLEQARRALASSRNAGVCCVALAFASTLAHVVVLARAPEGINALFQPLARGARFGQLDAEIALMFDPLSAAFAVLACLVALASAVLLSARPSAGSGWRAWAWLHLSLGGALVAFTADGFVGMALGWSLAGAGAAWLAGWNDISSGTVAAVRSTIALATMLVGATLLFWGLGGSWEGDDYIPDAQPRFATARIGGPSSRDAARHAEASEGALAPARPGQRIEERPAVAGGPIGLSLTGFPGASVYVDDARTTTMQAPFAGVPVKAGAHAIRIHTGDGAVDQVLRHVVFEEGGDDTEIVPVGPNLTFRGISDQLALHDRDGNPAVRNALEAHSGPGGLAVVAASLLALLAAAGLMSGTPPTGGGPLALSAVAQGATIVTLGPFMIARVALLFPLAPSTWIAVESIGAAILLVAGWRAPTSSGIQRWLAFLGVAPAALGILALGASGVTAATSVIVLSGMATAALYLGAASMVVSANAAGPVLARGPIEDLFLVRAPTRLGELLAGMDRWVVGAAVGAVAGLTRAGAWVMAMVDGHVVGGPGNAATTAALRAGRFVEPALGVKLVRVVWGVLATIACSALVHALWPGR